MMIQTRARYGANPIVNLNSLHLPGVWVPAALKTIFIVSTVALLFGYAFQISSLTAGGYEISKLEKHKAELIEENEKLRTEVASYQSMSNIQKRLESAGMVKASGIKYLKVQDSAVAQR